MNSIFPHNTRNLRLATCNLRAAAILFVICVSLAALAPAQTITTFAGNGTMGYGGDGGPATAAELNGQEGIAFNAAGDLLIADFYNCLIREINTSDTISTVAGTATNVGNGFNCGATGDGGPATSAELSDPGAVGPGSSGSFYIADSNNCRIRFVNSAGDISTVAGTGTCGYNGDGMAATAAQISDPSDVKLYSGNLYIADSGNERIRMVNSMGIITTVAGNGMLGYSGDGGPATSAELSVPINIAFDSAGNLYIADDGNCLVREVSSGTITTVAGVTSGAGTNGNCGYSGDGGPATAAMLNSNAGMAFDSSGNLYIADNGNCLVREVAGGAINTVAGVTTGAGSGFPPPNCGYTGDGVPATSSELNFPDAVAFDSSGNLYISDTGNNRIRKVATGGNCTATTVSLMSSPNPSVGGEVVTFTAMVSPAPTSTTGLGSVTWTANGAIIGSHGLLTSYDGVVGLKYSSLAPSASPYSIVATYNPPSGGRLCSSSSSPALMQTVNANSTTTTLSAPSSITYGQGAALDATVSAQGGVTPTGTVSFKNGSTTLGNVTLSGGSASLTTSALPAGMDSVTAVYEGSSLLPGSTSSAKTVSVAQATSTVSLSTTSSAIVYGQAATITATVTPEDGGHAGGTVTFTKNGAGFSTVSVGSGNTASISADSLGIGTFTIGATFNGDSNVSGSTASTISQTVNKDSSSTVTTSSASGTTVTITSTVTTTSPGTATPTGTVLFYNAGSSTTCGGTELGSATLSGGTATMKVTLADGTYNLCSVYEGNGYVTGSTSPTETQTVGGAT